MGTKRGEIKSFFQEDVFENAFVRYALREH